MWLTFASARKGGLDQYLGTREAIEVRLRYALRAPFVPLALIVGLSGACQPKAESGDAGAAADEQSKQQGEAKKEEAKEPEAEPNPNRGSALPPLPEVLATVGDRSIPKADFLARYEPEATKLLERRDDGKVPDAYQAMQREKIIDALIWSELMALEAERSGVDVSPEKLAEEEGKQKAHVADWNAWLERIGQTPEIRQAMTRDYLRERALIEARKGPIEATEEELRAAYDESIKAGRLTAPQPMARASHFLITYGPREGDEKIQPVPFKQREETDQAVKDEWKAKAKARAEALRELAQQPGVDFNEFCREYSEGPGAYRGGDMGLFPQTQMIKAYADVAFSLEIGVLSEPVESDKGYYVIKVFGRYEAGDLPFEAVRADLVRQVEGQKLQMGREALRKELEERFTVVSAPLDDAKAFRNKK